jgi:hypothetical protein
MKTTAFSLLCLGLLLLILSGVWTSVFNGTSTWTPAKAKRTAELRTRLHTLALVVDNQENVPSMHSGPELGKAKEEYEQLKKERADLSAEFQSASDQPKTAANVMRWSGLVLAACGVFGWYAVNQSR